MEAKIKKLEFQFNNFMVYNPNIGILDFYQDIDRLAYKREEIIKIREFLNGLQLDKTQIK